MRRRIILRDVERMIAAADAAEISSYRYRPHSVIARYALEVS